jgi:hypothetical protein
MPGTHTLLCSGRQGVCMQGCPLHRGVQPYVAPFGDGGCNACTACGLLHTQSQQATKAEGVNNLKGMSSTRDQCTGAPQLHLHSSLLVIHS